MEELAAGYRGKSYDEISQMSFEDFSLLLPSNLKRKVKRGFTDQEKKLINKVKSGKKRIRTHSREMFVIPEMIGKEIDIHNGKEFVKIKIIPEMIALKLGELAPTRKIGIKHSGKAAGEKKTETGGEKK